ncbi:13599_t:CDS:2, partial [Cetraspora pellucida]
SSLMWALSQRSMHIDEGSQDSLIFGKNSLVNLDTIIEKNSESDISDSTTSNLPSKRVGEPTDKISKLSTEPEASQTPIVRKKKVISFNDLYNNITNSEMQNEITNQDVIINYYLF